MYRLSTKIGTRARNVGGRQLVLRITPVSASPGCRQNLPRLRRVRRDLRLEGVKPGEFLLRAQIVDEGDAQVPAVKISREIEKMNLEAQIAAAEGRPQAEIGDAVVPGAVATDGSAHGVDAGRRAQIIGKLDVGGRKADGAASPVALFDAAIDFPVAAEQRGGLARLAFDEKMADASRRIDLARTPHRLDHGDGEAEILAHRGQQCCIAPAGAPEGASLADDRLRAA